MPSPSVGRKSAPVSRLLALLALATALSGCWEGTTREVLATILSIEGTAEISSDGGRSFAPLRLQDHPGRRAILKTALGSQVALAPLPNALVLLDGDTTVEIVRISLTKDGNETGSDMRARYVDLKLNSGRILTSHSWGEAIARFTVTTPQGELIVTSNALFGLETDAATTRITCVSGSLGFRPKDASSTTRIASGFVATSSGTNLELTPVDAAPGTQDTMVAALQREETLRELASRNRNVLPR